MTAFAAAAHVVRTRRRILTTSGVPEAAIAALSALLTLLFLEPATRTAAAWLLIAVSALGAAAFAFARPVAAVLCAWVLLVIQAVAAGLASAVSKAVGTFVGHLDEVTLVGLLLVLTARRLAAQSPRATGRPHRILVISVSGFLLLGLLSSAVAGPGIQTIIGMWYGLKIWLVIWVSLCVPWTRADLARVIRVMTTVGLIVAFFGVVDFLAPGPLRAVLHTGATHVRSFRAGAIQSVFGQPGAFSEFMSLVFALSAAHYVTTKNRSSLLSAGAFLLMSLMSLRLKSVLVPLAVLVILGTWRSASVRRKAAPVAMFVVLCLVVALPLYGAAVAGQAQKFTGSAGQTPRGKLYVVGADVAVQHFPLGAGFGRYGEYAATYVYSPVYQQHDFQFVYGLSPNRPQQLTDTSWPAVYGETGFLGLGCYALAVLTLFSALRRRGRSKDGEGAVVPAVTVLGALLVDSLGAPAIFNSLYVLTMAIFVGGALAITGPPSIPADGLRRPSTGNSGPSLRARALSP